MKIKRIPETELEIMQVVWSGNIPITTTQIKQELEKKRPWSQGAVQSLLARLVERGFLKGSMQGKNKAFEPLISEGEYMAVESASLLKKLRGHGSITQLITALYDTNELSEKDIEELDAFIEKIRKEEK